MTPEKVQVVPPGQLQVTIPDLLAKIGALTVEVDALRAQIAKFEQILAAGAEASEATEDPRRVAEPGENTEPDEEELLAEATTP